MAKRYCLECGGELVLAFRPSESSLPGSSNPKWRCSTCGHSFTADELRADKRAGTKLGEEKT
ncbi:MAG TPA: hypothetical protein VIL63_06930 [Terriglobales bacterium]